MAPILTAVRFARFMESGKTKPAIFACEDLSGAFAGEYVVKLRGAIEDGESGLLRELLAAELAEHFRIASPQPALIRIERDFSRAYFWNRTVSLYVYPRKCGIELRYEVSNWIQHLASG